MKSSRQAFRELHPRYRRVISILSVLTVWFVFFAIFAFNIFVLAPLLGIDPHAPERIQDQERGPLLIGLLMAQIAVLLPLGSFFLWPRIMRFVGRRLNWPMEDMAGISAGIRYPPEWRK